MSADEIIQLEQAITALEAQRALLGDAVINAALAPLREKLAALRSASPTEPQRKLISVLFADLSGFTAFSEDQDAEDVTTLMNVLWERIDRIILDHGGRIDKHIGDAVMAFWGADAAREDDAERAIKAALAMQSLKFGDQLSTAGLRSTDHQIIGLRIGVNTGPVLLSEVATTHEFTAIGDAVNTASRLEHACPLGGVLISHDTYQHVRGLFDLETQTPLAVKGKADPMQTYLVTAARPRRFRMSTRGIEGIETRTIGREADLLLLQDAYNDAIESQETRLVSVVGDPGIGKSRLLFEFENWISRLPQQPVILKARATPETQHHPAGLLHNLIASQLEILDTDSPAVVRFKYLDGLQRFATPEKAAVIGQLAGFDFSDLPAVQAALKNPAFDQMALAYLVSAARAIGANSPILFLLEDLHWADDRSLDLLTHLLGALPDQGMLVICLARPGLYERRADWGAGQALATRLDLKPLSTRQSRLLVSEILQRVADLPEALRDTIVHAAEGNPFYIEEMIKMLLDQGVISRGGSAETPWKVTLERMQSLEIPSTLTGVLQARLDALPPAEREALQRASVVGRLFWDASVHFLAGLPLHTPPSPEQLDIWEKLRQRELIFRRERSAFAGAQEFIFKHALLRDVAYESVLKRLRRQYHRLAAEWLIQAGSERVDEYADQIAAHWALAEDPAQEGEWQGRAGIQAAAHHAHAEALRCLQRALELTPENALERRYDLLLHRIQVLALQGDREAQRSDLDRLEKLAGQIQDPARESEAALRRSDYLEATGDYPAASDAAQRALESAQAAHDPAHIAEARLRWGRALWRQADYSQAQVQLEQSLRPARVSGAKREEMNALRNLGNVAWSLGDYPGARAYYQRALRLARTIADRQGEAAALNNLALVANSLGEPASARQTYQEALALYREIGDRRGEGLCLYNLGVVHRALEEEPFALRTFEQALVLVRQIGDRQIEAALLNELGFSTGFQGDYARSASYLDQALVLTRTLGDRRNEGLTLEGQGHNALSQGDPLRAHDLFLQAQQLMHEIGDRRGEGILLYLLGCAATSLGQLDEAQSACEESRQICRAIGYPKGSAMAEYYLALIQLYRGDPAGALVALGSVYAQAEQNEDRLCSLLALAAQGYALSDLERPREAAGLFARVLEGRQTYGLPSQAMEVLAALAEARLAQGDLPTALAHAQEVMTFLETASPDGAEEPLRLYRNLFQVLQAASDPRAPRLLQQAHDRLMSLAQRLAPEDREKLLQNVPYHREICAAWEGM